MLILGLTPSPPPAMFRLGDSGLLPLGMVAAVSLVGSRCAQVRVKLSRLLAAIFFSFFFFLVCPKFP